MQLAQLVAALLARGPSFAIQKIPSPIFGQEIFLQTSFDKTLSLAGIDIS